MNSEVEWKVYNQATLSQNSQLLAQCESMRNESRTTVDTRKATSDENKIKSDFTLNQRLAELDRHLELMRLTNCQLVDELEALRTAIEEVESDRQCLRSNIAKREQLNGVRECRAMGEKVDDSALHCIDAEIKSLEESLANFDSLHTKLKASKDSLEKEILLSKQEIERKTKTLEIDSREHAKGLQVENFKNMPPIGHNVKWTNDLRQIKLESEQAAWIRNTRQHMNNAQSTIQHSKSLRAASKDLEGESEAQHDLLYCQTGYELRRRLHECRISLKEFSDSHQDLCDELEACRHESKSCVQVNEYLKLPQNLCESRLQARKARPGIELCKDKVSGQLKSESEQVDRSRKDVSVVNSYVDKNIQLLAKKIGEMKSKIEAKSATVQTEEKALAIHESIRLYFGNKENGANIASKKVCE